MLSIGYAKSVPDEGSASAEKDPSPVFAEFIIGRRFAPTPWRSHPLPQGERGRTTPLRLVAAFLAAGLEQEPGAALGLVDEGLEQTGGAGILVLVGELVRLAHRGGDVLVVFHQLAQHFARRHIGLIVVLDGLRFPDLPDRA